MDVKRKLLAAIRRADFDYGLIEKGDRIMVGVSGGKDSVALLYLLSIYQRFADKDFTFRGIMLDLGFPKNDLEPLLSFAQKEHIPLAVSDASEVYGILTQHKKGDQLPCSICSRMKKAAINKVAHELGYRKVAFAHHGDDAIETLLMNMTHGGRLATFAPKMLLERSGIEFVRPLIYAREDDIKALVKQCGLPVIKSTCQNDQTSQRATFKSILNQHYERFPDARDNFMTMLFNAEKADLWFDHKGFSNGDGLFIKICTTASDMAKAVFIRNKVFLQEQGVEPHDEFDRVDFEATSYLLLLNEEPVATIRQVISGEEVHLGRLAVLAPYRLHGCGTALLRYVEKRLSQQHTPLKICLGAQLQAQGFYQKNGYEARGDVFLDAGIQHIMMQKVIMRPIMDKAKTK